MERIMKQLEDCGEPFVWPYAEHAEASGVVVASVTTGRVSKRRRTRRKPKHIAKSVTHHHGDEFPTGTPPASPSHDEQQLHPGTAGMQLELEQLLLPNLQPALDTLDRGLPSLDPMVLENPAPCQWSQQAGFGFGGVDLVGFGFDHLQPSLISPFPC